jgi:nucleoid-associated protein EbfC
MFDPQQLNQMLEQVQGKTKELQAQNENITYNASSGGGLIKAIVNGNSELIDLEIDDSLLEDKESLQILLISAINDAIQSAEKGKKSQAMQMLGGLGESFGFGGS